MENKDLIKAVKVIESNFSRKLNGNEIKALSEELKNYTYKQFEEDIKPKLLNKTDYFTVQALHKIIVEKNNNANFGNLNNANLNSSYWYEIEREWCEQNNKPYYDITKGPDYPLPPFKD